MYRSFDLSDAPGTEQAVYAGAGSARTAVNAHHQQETRRCQKLPVSRVHVEHTHLSRRTLHVQSASQLHSASDCRLAYGRLLRGKRNVPVSRIRFVTQRKYGIRSVGAEEERTVGSTTDEFAIV